MTRSIGVVLLICFLALFGIISITNITFQLQGFLLGILAIAAAVFLAWGK